MTRAPHPIPDHVSHAFHSIGRRREPPLRGPLIGSVMIKISQKFSDRHPHLASRQWALHSKPQAPEGSLQGRPLRQFQGLTGQLVQGFAGAPTGQGLLVSSTSALQLADEMDVTPLQDPPVVTGQRLHPTQIVSHHASHAPSYLGRDGVNAFRPDHDGFPSRAQHRVQQDRVILTTGFDRHQLQHPRALSEAKPQAIDQQDQVSGGRRSGGRAGQAVAQRVAAVVAEPLGRQPLSPGMGVECGQSQQDSFHQGLAQAPGRTAALRAANSPCSSTRTALPTSATEAIEAGSTTSRFRV